MNTCEKRSYPILFQRGNLHRLAYIAVLLGMCVLGNLTCAQVVNDVYAFTDYSSSGNPETTLAQGRDGRIYGTTLAGGTNGWVFSVSTGGAETDLFAFDSSDGSDPNAGVSLASDGNFYGTAFGGGNNQDGVLFKITPTGTYTVLHYFVGGADGSAPSAAPTETSDGAFYGTTLGDSTGSTVYKYTNTGGFTTIHQFPSQTVIAPVIQGIDGKLYGTENGGGANGCGAVFKMSTAGKLLKAFSFLCGPHGAYPGPLIQANDGNFYGTTAGGGTNGKGTVFKFVPGSPPVVLYSFQGGPSDGSDPGAGLMQATDGNLYGTTNKGGSSNLGTVFQISTSGVYKQLYSFAAGTGESPLVGLTQHTNGQLYGTTEFGGTNGFGVVYSLNMGLRPFITFVQATGKIGGTAQILGQGFSGTTSVTFNGVPAASFKVLRDTYMVAVVPSGATTGPVVATTPSGALTSNKNFIVH